MSGKRVDRATERRRILRAIGRDDTHSDGDALDDGRAADARTTADLGPARRDVVDLPFPDPAESDSGE